MFCAFQCAAGNISFKFRCKETSPESCDPQSNDTENVHTMLKQAIPRQPLTRKSGLISKEFWHLHRVKVSLNVFEFGIVDFGFWISDLGLWISDSGFPIWDFGFRILDFRFGIVDFGFWISDLGLWISDSGFPIWDFGFWNLDFRFGILDFGIWI